jgi:hypothetical protein
MVAKVHFFPLGDADTLRIDLANGEKVLVDYANMRNPADKNDLRCDLPEELRRDLAKARRNNFDVVCITHLDDDHCKGFGEFFWLRHAKIYQSSERILIDVLWVPACALLETGLTGDARLVRQEAIHRLREGKGVLIFSRPEPLKDWMKENGIDYDSRKHLFVDAGKLVPGYRKEGPAQAEFFVHSPFGHRQDDGTVIDRNGDAIVMQVTFREGQRDSYLFLGSDTRAAVLLGAGAIGSHVADCLVREGRFTWTVIDDDQLLPHNLARHTALGAQVTRPKAEIVAERLNAVLSGPAIAQAVNASLFDTGSAADKISRTLGAADIIIDATASVVAARALSDGAYGARRISAFFNPSGEAAVLLGEPADRSLTLRDLEAQYFGLILRTPRLASHLGKEAKTIAYTGACRAITSRIPESRASVLSGLAASGLSAVVDAPAGAISVWSLAWSGEVAFDSAPLEPVSRYKVRGWTIAVDAGLIRRIHEMRRQKLPRETGGILFGLVDIPAQQIHIVDGTPPPPGSVEEPGGFVRGMGGVDEMMQDLHRRTAGQVRYVGEWHSHPPRHSARPSAIDGRQLDWLAALMGMDAMPGLMVIAADGQVAVILASETATRAGVTDKAGA